jgi:hypothetical protein
VKKHALLATKESTAQIMGQPCVTTVPLVNSAMKLEQTAI